MASKNISFKYKNKKINISARKCLPSSFGLMFRTRNTKPCLFEFNNPQKFKLTSLFVFFNFIVIWLDKNKKVLDIRKIKPFTFCISSQKNFSKVLEIPINKKNNDFIKILVGDRKI